MIADLLAYLREGFAISGCLFYNGRDCWRIVKNSDYRYVPLPTGWVKPQ